MSDIYPSFDKFLSQEKKEEQLGQKSKVYWLYGQSGSGKTTLAIELEKKLTAEGRFVVVLDGDNLRSGLNQGLGFSTEDRIENIRRAAEVAKILIQNGIIVIACFVCPLKIMREKAKEIIGAPFREIYIHASLETLVNRDTKGFYKRALEGKMEHLTGVNAEFEKPENSTLIIDTDRYDVIESLEIILEG